MYIDALPSTSKAGFDPAAISRPDSALLRYYLLIALLSGPLFPIAVLPLLCKYATLRYRFDHDGIWMRWGVLFRREVNLTYRRIQDIHLTANVIQRWMGLATVAIQTASGNAGPEMSIEGILEAEPLRDYLYSQMRGARGLREATDGTSAISRSTGAAASDESLALLREISDTLRQLATSDGGKHE